MLRPRSPQYRFEYRGFLRRRLGRFSLAAGGAASPEGAVVPLRGLVQAARELAAAYGRHQVSQHAAAIAYRVMFSLVPFVALVVSVVDLVLPASRRQQFIDWVFGALPGNELEHSVDHALDESRSAGPLVGLLSLALLLWGASGMMASLRRAFGAVWGVEQPPPYVRGKLRDVALVAGAGAFLVGAFALSVVAQVVSQTGTDVAGALGWDAGGLVTLVVDVATSSLAVGAALLAVYRVVPPVPVTLADAWPGALAAALACQLAVRGFAIYAANIADFNTAYGSLGTVFAFLVLVYVLAIIVLLGAELVVARAARRGKADGRPLV
jgi:membrane protein